MRLAVTGAMTGLVLAFATSGPVLAEEQQTTGPLSATEITYENGGNTARITAVDQVGASHVFVVDLSQLSDAQRQALGVFPESIAQQDGSEDVPTGTPGREDTDGVIEARPEGNAVLVPPSSFATDLTGIGTGHASDSSNNIFGDIAEGLSNQKVTEDDEANGGSHQPNGV